MRVIIVGGGRARPDGSRRSGRRTGPADTAAGAASGLRQGALDVFTGIGVGEQTDALGTTVSTWFRDASGNRFHAPGCGEQEHALLLLPRRSSTTCSPTRPAAGPSGSARRSLASRAARRALGCSEAVSACRNC